MLDPVAPGLAPGWHPVWPPVGIEDLRALRPLAPGPAENTLYAECLKSRFTDLSKGCVFPDRGPPGAKGFFHRVLRRHGAYFALGVAQCNGSTHRTLRTATRLAGARESFRAIPLQQHGLKPSNVKLQGPAEITPGA